MKLTQKQQEWLNQLANLWKYLDKWMDNFDLKTPDLRLFILLHMTGAVHRIIRGFIAQLKGGSNDDLEGKLRTLAEATININYILAVDTDNRAKAFVMNGIKSRLSAIRRLINLLERKKAPAMSGITSIDRYKNLQHNFENELTEFQRRFGKENLIWPNIEQRAREGNSEELYATAFWLFSEDSHMTAEGLNRFLKDNNGQVLMMTALDLSRLDMQIQTAYISYIAFINTCLQRLGFPTKEELVVYNKSEMLPEEYKK